MKKRMLSMLLALALCLGLCAVPAFAADSGFTIKDGVLTKYTGPGGDVTIPDSVTSIGIFAFRGCTGLTSVTIPSSVTSIGSNAFQGCTGLTSVNIPPSVTSIRGGAFADTPWLKSHGDFTIVNGILLDYNGPGGDVAIPDSVTTIGEGAFDTCQSLTGVTIPYGVTSIGHQAFHWCTSLTSVTIPSSVTSIGTFAFSHCINLTGVTIPPSVTSIGDNVFFECPNPSILGAAGSYAETYAKENNIPFYSISRNDTVPSDICSKEEWEVLVLVNQERQAWNLVPLSTFAALQSAADVREQELAVSFSHTRPDGEEFSTVLKQKDIRHTEAGENIASGQLSAEEAMESWMNSPGHKANILSALGAYNYTHIGVGYNGSGGLYGTSWVQLFVDNRCTTSGISLSQSDAIRPASGNLDDLGLYVTAVCNAHGICYLPLLSGMCSGFDSSAAGTQTVTVTYRGQTAQLQLWDAPDFHDTPADAYYAIPVAWAVEKGITNGTGDTTFSPKQTCTHAQILTFLWRAAGKPESSAQPPITMKGNEFYYKAVKWAAEKGMIDKNFKPDAPCNRAYAVQYIWQAKGKPAPTSASPFTDVPAHWSSAPAVAWAVENGITNGKTATTFNPGEICNRGQIVTFLYRAYK